jgi:LPS export ABC transporter permease LptG/LPS export ABC transporter permease LptF
LSEVFSHGAIGLALFTFVIFMRDLGRLLELIVRNSAPLPSVAEIFFLTLPSALTVTLPMAVLVGILIGLSRLAADSEVTAIRASGMGAMLFVRIVSIFAVFLWIVALINNVYVAPRSAAALAHLQDKLKSSQASFEIQPRVFYEDFKNAVLYVEDTKESTGSALWKGVFLADVTNPSEPKITMAEHGFVVPEGTESLHMHLENGTQQETNAKDPSQYQVSTFNQTDIPIQLPETDKPTPELVPVAELSTRELWRRAHIGGVSAGHYLGNSVDQVKARWYAVEFQRRLALPTACLVLAVVGIPLGLSSRRGGKSMGFVLTIVLVFVYYVLSLVGVSLGRGGKLPPAFGVWMGNAVFFVAGIFLLYRVDRAPIDLSWLTRWWETLREKLSNKPSTSSAEGSGGAFEKSFARTRVFRAKFPLLLDDMILRDFLLYFIMVLATFVMLALVFTFFELLGDIVRNRISMLMLGDYLLNLSPSLIYLMTPLSVLLAVLVTFGLMQRSNEITAMKATGISIYRVAFPVIVIAAVVAGSLFLFDQLYIPKANKRQETLRNEIKGKPPQTYLRPDRKWIFGSNHTIYYYELYDPDQNRFGGISIFQFDPKTFVLTARIYAQHAHWEDGLQKWVFEKGWIRRFNGSAIEEYRPFDVTTTALAGEPPAYFKKEVRQSQEMDYTELLRYIRDLQQSGFDVVRFRVQLYKKIAYPVITLVMAILAIPFSVSRQRRGGALAGVATAIGIAILYWVSAGLFEAMGNANQLPALLAAWAPNLIFGFAAGYMVLRVPT